MKLNGFVKLKLQSKVSVIAILSSIWKTQEINKDLSSEKKLIVYIKNSKKLLSKLQAKIDQINKSHKVIYVWGAGIHTQKLLALTNLIKIKIRAFIDTNPNYHQAKLISKSIISPERLIKEPNLPILISSKGYQGNIKKQIQSLGLKNKVLTLY